MSGVFGFVRLDKEAFVAQKVIIFVPGYSCSSLVGKKDRAVIWPDKVLSSPKDQAVKLLGMSGLTPGAPVLSMPGDDLKDRVVCGHFVDFVVRSWDCLYICEHDVLPKTRRNLLIGFGYDWRDSLVKPARHLGQLLDRVFHTYGPDCEIWLVAHSMGPLVCRYLIESGLAKDAEWSLKGLIALGGAHLGTPLSLSSMIGEIAEAYNLTPEQWRRFNILSQDQVQILSNYPNHPSIYQMLPPEQIRFVRQGPADRSIYDPGSPLYQLLITDEPEGFGADPKNFEAAREFFAKLQYGPDRNDRPDYYIVYGTGVRTIFSLDYDPSAKNFSAVLDDGDGMIPTYSARFDGGWVKEAFSVCNVIHGDLLSQSDVLAQIQKWIG
jgi:hypothetical protein